MVICPICRCPLRREKKLWHCENNHSFDVAKQGYVNLLPVQQKHSIAPGDTREMVLARRNFLDTKCYKPIANTLKNLLLQYAPDANSILDAGCGEGYYLSHFTHIENRWGIDISKEAVRFASARDKNANWLTATAAHLPFEDQSFDCVISMFAFTAEAEFARVLKPNGIFIQVLAGTHHLSALKKIIYPEIIEKEKILHPELDGFTRLESKLLSFEFELTDHNNIHNLLYMTPHVHRISKAGAEALQNTTFLRDRAEVVFNVYRVDNCTKI